MNEMSKKEIIELFIKTLFNWFSEFIENKKKPRIKDVNKIKEYPIISARVDEKTRRLLTYNKELENVPYIINIINHTNHPIENKKSTLLMIDFHLLQFLFSKQKKYIHLK